MGEDRREEKKKGEEKKRAKKYRLVDSYERPRLSLVPYQRLRTRTDQTQMQLDLVVVDTNANN